MWFIWGHWYNWQEYSPMFQSTRMSLTKMQTFKILPVMYEGLHLVSVSLSPYIMYERVRVIFPLWPKYVRENKETPSQVPRKETTGKNMEKKIFCLWSEHSAIDGRQWVKILFYFFFNFLRHDKKIEQAFEFGSSNQGKANKIFFKVNRCL